VRQERHAHLGIGRRQQRDAARRERLADLLHQRHRIGDARVFDDAHVERAVAQREVTVGQRRKGQCADAVLGRRFRDSHRIWIADHDQARTTFDEPSRQGRDGRADEEHAPPVRDGLGVGG
jgi:hypothetical protein